MDRMLEDHLRIVTGAVAQYPHLAPLERRRVAQIWLSAALRLHENKQTAQAYASAWKALRADPRFIKTVPALGLITMGPLGRWVARRIRWSIQFTRRSTI
jgi:hypothetical protein